MATIKVVEPPKADVVADPPKVETPDLAAELAATKARADEMAAKLAERDAADKKAREKAMADQGKHKELLTQREAELAEATAKLAKHEEREAARVASVEKANAAALKALPESFRKLAPTNLDADGMAAWLETAKATAADAEERPAGGVPRAIRGGAEPHPDAVAFATARKLDPVSVHNSFVAAGRLPKDVKPIPVA